MKNKNEKDINISDICKFLLSIEDKYDLFNIKVSNIYFWKLIRFRIFNDIARGCGLFTNKEGGTDTLLVNDKVKFVLRYIYYSLFNNAINDKKNVDYIVFQSSRRRYIDGKYLDIYTNSLTENLKKKNSNYQLIDTPTLYAAPLHNKGDCFALPNLISKFIYRKFKEVKFSEEETKIFITISDEIYKLSNMKINIKEYTRLYIKIFLSNKKYYDKLFSKKKPKEIFLINSYGKEPLIAAAKEQGVKVTELQHGIITKYHTGYSFGENKHIPYFPNKLLLFGKFWKDSVKYPLDNENIKIYGYPFLLSEMRQYKNLSRDNNKILFLSQPTINNQLAEYAYKLAVETDYNIVYKLHPATFYENIKEDHVLKKCEKMLNFKLVIHNEINLYELMYACGIQVGAYSTALFEGVYTGLATVIIDMPGIEHMEAILEEDRAVLCNSPDELVNCIKKAMTCIKTNEADYYYADKSYNPI